MWKRHTKNYKKEKKKMGLRGGSGEGVGWRGQIAMGHGGGIRGRGQINRPLHLSDLRGADRNK